MKLADEDRLLTLEPKRLWHYFVEFCKAVPRISGQEQGGTEFVKRVGAEFGLEMSYDKTGNVIINKPATPGMENRKPVILQAHLDMVTDKVLESAHDFEKDPIEAYVDAEWVTARGTTLGADDGIGVASILAILEAKDIVHGPLVGVFTIDEEQTFAGVRALQPGMVVGDILLNLDGEELDTVFIGSAGAIITHGHFSYQQEPVPKDYLALTLKITGLRGGHSGADIHLGRANANKILGQLLWEASRDYKLRLAAINGGAWPNSITREAEALFMVPAPEKRRLVKFIKKRAAGIKSGFKQADPELEVIIKAGALPNAVFDLNSQEGILNAIYNCPDGVAGWSITLPGLVEVSSNLGVVRMEEGGVEMVAYQRGFADAPKYCLKEMVSAAFKLGNADLHYTHEDPGWVPNENSEILALYQQIYKAKYGKEANATAIHAALECSLFAKLLPGVEMLSFGPNIDKAHSPEERVEISSVAAYWEILLALLTKIPEQNA